MRFYEFEAKAILAKQGVRLPKGGTAKNADEARKLATEIGGPVVLKSQVLSGGRMKAGGVKFADTPDEAAAHAEAILKLPIKDQMPVYVLRRGEGGRREGVLPGRHVRRRREAAGDDLQRHGRHRHRGGGRDTSRTTSRRCTSRRSSHSPTSKRRKLVASLGITGGELTQLTGVVSRLVRDVPSSTT